ncbi:cytochrome P450 [Lactarius hengduanensis]|nr:cytochrome P450 [Lactarius hengduanensis]
MALLLLFVLIVWIVTLYALRPLFNLVLSRFRSPLRLLPSPPSPSFLVGNLAQISDEENNDIFQRWAQLYGHTFIYRGFINCPRLITTDPLALAYILGHAYDFPRPDFLMEALAEAGAGREGLLTAQGDVHRRQRRILNQAFSPSHIKSIIPIFREKAERLRDIFTQIADAPPSVTTTHTDHVPSGPDSCTVLRSPLEPACQPPSTRHRTSPLQTADSFTSTRPAVDVLSWLTRATLDIIGEAGFGYSFHSLPPPGTDHSSANRPESELAHAFAAIFSTSHSFSVLSVLAIWFPFLRRFRPNSRALQEAQATMQRIGTQLINERKSAPLLDEPFCEAQRSRDILSVLIRANATSSPCQALTHSEMLSQITTFLVAGHETTASAITWTLYALARAPVAQAQLRAALRACDKDDLYTALELPLLEYTVREALRLHAPVRSTMRVYAGAAPDCFVPLQRPVRVRWPTWHRLTRRLRFRSRSLTAEEDGNHRWHPESSIHLRHGDIVTIPIQTVNRAPDLWGPDAHEFRPERWTTLPPAVRAVPGLYAHTLTFLNGNGSGTTGNRACIGYRFALAEIKVFLACLLRDLEFTIDDDVVIKKRTNIVTRPIVASSPEIGFQMPLRLRRVPPDEVVGAPNVCS